MHVHVHTYFGSYNIMHLSAGLYLHI